MDWVISDELSLTVGHVVGWVSAGAIIVGGVVPYIPQYRQIKRTQDTEGFSLLVCLALLIANTLRIMFWFGKHFEYPLLIQSVIMNLAMFSMIHLCVRVRNRNQLVQARQRIFTDLELRHFWNWSDFQSYIDCMLVFTILISVLMYFLIDHLVFVEAIGFLAVFTEAMLGTPQLMKNFNNKSTEGMSVGMVVMWTFGDVFKTLYFILRDAPIQFCICGTIQVSVDILILLQVFFYRHNSDPLRTGHNRGD
ncbi:solute carrier family 66 member 2 isoform X2 [Coccinella septempunctata]|uniref:solute carrier family 66 member 2 isoform X2 n=1 Tax=Coccinella septempunctata TaxID=41139 RepID=UPI001D08BE89|nr:solute carrier family 66 member 2 isoform X2 [Coccinella septempunctata]